MLRYQLFFTYFYVVTTVHSGIKLYNDQRNAHVFKLFIYLLLPYMFRAFFNPNFSFTNSAVVPSAAREAPPEDEQVMFETSRRPSFLTN
jgi:hypothetical protein